MTDSLTATAEHRVERKMQEKTKYGIGVLVFLVQLAALVWGASAINSSVHGLERTTEKMGELMAKMTEKLGDVDGRLRVVEDRTKRGNGGQ